MYVVLLSKPSNYNLYLQLSHTAQLLRELHFTSCLKLVVRGYNKVGLSASVSKEITSCQSHLLDKLDVIDAVGTWDATQGDVKYVYGYHYNVGISFLL